MRLIEVKALMLAPIVVDYDVHLDALLAWVVAKRTLGELNVSRRTPASEIVRFDVPLQAVTALGHRVWACTVWDLPSSAKLAGMHLTKRKDGEDVLRYRRRFLPNSGPGRNELVRRNTVAAASVTWRAVGDPDAVREMLGDVTHIGSTRRHGHGRVREWVAEDLGAPEQVLVRNGQATRNLPLSWVVAPDSLISHGAIEAPYWHPGMHMPIVRPGANVELRDGIA